MKRINSFLKRIHLSSSNRKSNRINIIINNITTTTTTDEYQQQQQQLKAKKLTPSTYLCFVLFCFFLLLFTLKIALHATHTHNKHTNSDCGIYSEKRQQQQQRKKSTPSSKTHTLIDWWSSSIIESRIQNKSWSFKTFEFYSWKFLSSEFYHRFVLLAHHFDWFWWSKKKDSFESLCFVFALLFLFSALEFFVIFVFNFDWLLPIVIILKIIYHHPASQTDIFSCC